MITDRVRKQLQAVSKRGLAPGPPGKESVSAVQARVPVLVLRPLLATFLAVVVLLPLAAADEGMWLFNDLPVEQLQENYDFTPAADWTKHIMHASVRFNSGGSASFVSHSGLVLTNHHVGAETLHKLSTAQRNYYEDGFYAKSLAEEIPAPDLELNQLVSIDDVTERVDSAVKPGMSASEALVARRAAMSRIEKLSLDETGLRSDVITLYGGARYHLYRYKKYTDVRLVWAPESGIAFFGGDADNFEYPRYCLDVCIFRVYENDQPAKIEHFLKISRSGPQQDQLVFVSGNPGSTQRIFTLAALKYQRDHYVPYLLNYFRRREILFQQFGLEGDEQQRRANDELFGIQNSRKAVGGMLQGLQDPAFLARKRQEEAEFLKMLQRDPRLSGLTSAWQTVEEVQSRRASLLGQTGTFSGRLYWIAEHLVFLAAEDQKPNEKRLREYRETARESLLQQLFFPAPLYSDLERVKLADSLALLVERRGGDHPLVQDVLSGKSPQERAFELVRGTQLANVENRRQLARGGQAGIDASQDPMIQLAKLMEPEARRLRDINDELDELERQAYAKIANAQFAIQGTTTYPDATFTLRLAFGTVKGYVENGQPIPPWTTVDEAFQHQQKYAGKDNWRLPESWRASRSRLNPQTPFNFVCTADIIGGNSGSPVVNRDGELVGVIFDGNIQSLTSDYFYTDHVARAVAVTSSVLIEALRKVYDAKRLADELLN